MVADRDILFQLRVAAHPENQRQLAALADTFKQTTLAMAASVTSVGTRAAEASRLIAASGVSAAGSLSGIAPPIAPPVNRVSGSLADAAGSGIGSERQRVLDSLGALREEVSEQARSLGGEAAKVARKSFTGQIGQLAGLSLADLKTLLGADDQDLLALAENQSDKYVSGLRSGLKSQLGEGINTDELFSAQGGAGLKNQQREYAAETEKVTFTLASQVEEMERLKTAGDSTGKALTANFRSIAERGEALGSGLAQVASGIGFLFAESEDAKKLIDTLLTIKGTADVVVGGFKTFTGITTFFGTLAERSTLLAEKQKIQTAQTKLAEQATASYVTWLEREGIELRDAVGGNQQHADALRRAAAAANEAAAAEARLNAERNKPQNRARDIGGQLVQSAVGGQAPAQNVRGGSQAPAQNTRVGRLRGAGTGIGSLLGFEAISRLTGGNNLASQIGSIGLDSLFSRGAGAAVTATTAPVAGAGAAAVTGTTTAAVTGAGTGAAVATGAGTTATTGLAALAAPAAAAAAALGAIALVGKEVQEIFSGTANKAGSLTDTIGSTQASLGSWALSLTRTSGIASAIGDLVGDFGVFSTTLGNFDVVGLSTLGAFGDLAKSSKDLEEAQKRAAKATEQAAQDKLTAELTLLERSSDRAGADFQRGNTSTLRGLAVDSGSLTALKSSSLASRDAMRELAAEQKKIADYAAGIQKSEELHVDSLKAANDATSRMVEAQQRQIAALREESQLRQSISEQSVAAAERRIGLIEGESKKIEALGKAAENSLLSSAEKFARLSDGQQRAAIQAQRIAQQGGKLTDKQQDLLASVGGAAGADAVRRQNLAEARQKGFFETFGGSEQQLARAAEASRLDAQQRAQAAAQQRVRATLASASADGRISLDERRQIEGARQGLNELRQRQAIENRETDGDRRRAAGFAVEQNARDSQRLGVNAQTQQRIGLEITRQVEFQVIVKNDLREIDQRIQASIARALRANNLREAEVRKIELQNQRAARTQAFNQQRQQEKNSKPS